METSVFIGRIFAICYLAIGLGLLVKPDNFQKMVEGLDADPGDTYMWGLFVLIIGSLIVVSHNLWVASWPVIITIIGWGAVLKGFALILYPESLLWFTRRFGKDSAMYRGIGVFVLVVALAIGYFSFGL